MHYCDQERITFARPRPCRKNENCFMEQKNNVVVRTWIGHARFDTSQERTLMNGLYSLHRLYFNFFPPQMKLVEKTRAAANVRGRYDTPQTPYERLWTSSVLDQSGRVALEAA